MPAKKGNKNALKHGIYSRFIAVNDTGDMAGMSPDNTRDELSIARVRLVNALKEFDKAQGDDRVKWDYACRHWVEVINALISTNKNQVNTEVMVFTTAMDAIRALHDKKIIK